MNPLLILIIFNLFIKIIGSEKLPIYPLDECDKMTITYYDASTPSVSCSMGRGTATGAGIYTAAPNFPFRSDAAVCGTCYELVGSQGTVKVMVTDTCPGDCYTDGLHFDLSEEAFAAIEDPLTGYTEVSYRLVSCDVEGPVKYQWIPDSHTVGDYFSIIVFNHAVGVESVEVWQNGQWEELIREDWNEFKWTERGQFTLPSKFKITSIFGDSIEKDIDSIQPSVVESLSRQFEVPEEEFEPYKNTCCNPVNDPTLIYYDDSIHGWNDWGSGNAETSGGYVGQYCYSASFSAWQEGIQFGKNDGQTVTDYSALEFYIKTNLDSYSGLQIYFYQTSTGEYHIEDVSQTIGTTWTYVSVPMTSISFSGSELNKIAWKNGMNAGVTMYIDQARLIEVSTEEKNYCVDGIATFDDDDEDSGDDEDDSTDPGDDEDDSTDPGDDEDSEDDKDDDIDTKDEDDGDEVKDDEDDDIGVAYKNCLMLFVIASFFFVVML